MKNKFFGFLIVLMALSIYPTWRYFNHAKVFTNALFNHASSLGNWSQGSTSTSLDGKITIRGSSFIPKNYSQGLNIESIDMVIDPMFLLMTGSEKLKYLLPESMSLSVNGVSLNTKNNDLNTALRNDSLWMLMAGYGGSFGCKRESFTSFDKTSWESIIKNHQLFNLDLYYFRQANSTIDVDLILDAENLFSSTWSGNLKSSYNDQHIIVDELIVDKIFYNYLDNGYNLIRNDVCKENYQSSFSTYRLSSAEHLQKYLRTYFSKELPKALLNWYQRMLAPDVEYNAIITLNERKYINEIYRIDQRELFENSVVEISTTGKEYLPVTLKNIDYTNIDSEFLQKENLNRKAYKNQATQNKPKTEVFKFKPTIFTTGGPSVNKTVTLKNIRSALNKKIRIKTKKGRPITGILRKIDSEILWIESKYKSGNAKLAIPINKIASIKMVK